MKTGFYEVYRDGHGDVRDRIEEAVADFYRRHNALPAEIVVPRSQVDEVATALKALGLSIPVVTSGGCLAGEVWLGVGDD